MMKTKEMILISEENYKKMGVEILSVFDNFCRTNNIPYILGYGTLLGAIRHNGYIPWDDDIDLFVFAEDCLKIAKTYTQTGDYKYHNCLYSKTYFLPFDKFSDERTIKVENCNIKMNQQIGFNIDIFPIYCFENKEIAEKCFKSLRFLRKRFRIKIANTNGMPIIKKIIFKTLQLFEPCNINLLSRKIIKKIEKMSCNSSTPNAVATIISDIYSDSLVLLDINFIKNRITHTFENNIFNIPKDYNALLTILYGNYLTPPPLKERVTHHGFLVYIK